MYSSIASGGATNARLGTWSMIGHPIVIESLARSGADFVGLDLQHGAFDYESAARAIQLLDVLGVPSRIRISVREIDRVPQHLDQGASGVILAMIETPAETARAIELVRYQPIGRRSYGGTRYGMHPDPLDLAAHLPEVYAMIETESAFENVEAIASVAHLAGLYVGPVDLGLAIGAAPVLDDARFVTALGRVVAAARAASVRAGCFAVDGEHATRLVDLGFDDVVIASDIALLGAATARELTRGRGAVA
jgi:4-hydroxy-2-oxoheptanedioate aldolase